MSAVHPDEDELQAFAEGALDPERRGKLELHLDACSECLGVVASFDQNPDQVKGRQVGRFSVGDLIGHGAMGAVYRAMDTHLGRAVALKVLHQPDDATLERLLAEARAQAKVQHPHVVTLFEAGVHEGVLALVLQLVEGPTLRTWQQGRTWQEVLRAYLQAGSGLSAAHASGVVHRDFKPDNVVVDLSGLARVTDFGLASTTSGTTSRGGTPAYLAPETAAQGVCDARSDQYGYCVAVWEGLTGSRVIRAPLRGPPPAVFACLRKGLSANPDDRYQSMDELLSALARAAHPRRRSIALLGVAALSLLSLAGWTFASPSRVVEGRVSALFVTQPLPAPVLAALARREPELRQAVRDAHSSAALACLGAHLADYERVIALAREPTLAVGLSRFLDRLPSPSRCSRPQQPRALPAPEPEEAPLASLAVVRSEALLLQWQEQAALEAALEAERLGGPPAVMARAAVAKGLALASLARPDEAVTALRTAELLAQRSGDDELRVRAELAQVMELCRGMGATTRCGEVLRRAQDGAGDPAESVKIELLEFEASWLGQQTFNARAQPLLEAACARWEKLPAFGPELLRCRVSLATNAETVGLIRRAAEVAGQVTAQARLEGPSFTLYRALRTEASIAVAAGQVLRAARLAAEARALEAVTPPTKEADARLRALEAVLAEQRGALDEAITLEQQVVAQAGDQHPGWRRKHLVQLGRWLAEAGRWTEARATLAPFIDSNPGWRVRVEGDTYLAVQASMVLAIGSGDWAAASEMADWIRQAMEVRGSSSRYLLPFLGWRAEVQLGSGHLEEARAQADEMERRFAELEGASLQLIAPARIVTARLEARESPQSAAHCLDELVAALRTEGSEGRFTREAEAWAALWTPDSPQRCARLRRADQDLGPWKGLEVSHRLTEQLTRCRH